MDFLFGSTKEVSRPADVTPPELAGLRGPFADALKNLLGATGTTQPLSGVPASGLATSAPVAPGEQQLLTLLQGLGGGQGGGLIADTLAGKFLPGQAGSNPFLNAIIEAAQRPTLEGLTRTLTEALPGRFTAAGQFIQPQGSSAFDRAAATATGEASRAVSDIATKLSGAAFETERGRQQEAIGLGQREVETAVTNLGAQALPRLIQELGIERGLQEYQTRLNAVLQALAVATGAPLSQTGTETVREQKPGAFSALFPQGLTSSGSVGLG